MQLTLKDIKTMPLIDFEVKDESIIYLKKQFQVSFVYKENNGTQENVKLKTEVLEEINKIVSKDIYDLKGIHTNDDVSLI